MIKSVMKLCDETGCSAQLASRVLTDNNGDYAAALEYVQGVSSSANILAAALHSVTDEQVDCLVAAMERVPTLLLTVLKERQASRRRSEDCIERIIGHESTV